MPRPAYPDYAHRLEDFWGRRDNAPLYRRDFTIMGCPVEMTSNQARALDSVDHSLPQYSRAPARPGAPLRIQWVARPPADDPGAPPEHPAAHLQYTGSGNWLHLQLGAWGSVFADLHTGTTTGILTPALAARPDLLSRAFLNTLLNNHLTARGFAMLHATGLARGRHALLLMAPHNTGKSTAALRLALSGEFQLLSDSQIYVTAVPGGTQLTGFPVGRGKLRRDMLPYFPRLQGLLTPEQVRGETKFVLDLRALDPSLILAEALLPQTVTWCLLTRTPRAETTLRPAAAEEIWQAVIENSLHYDERAQWEANLHQIEPLVQMARHFHLEAGTDGEALVKKILEIGDW
jgi:hypothetical protein